MYSKDPGFIGRSQRYAIRTCLQYKIKGDRWWHEGTCLNVSESGILFEGDPLIPPSARFEVRLTLPSVPNGCRAPSIYFHATLVRSLDDHVWAAGLSGAVILRKQPEQERMTARFAAIRA
jgi:hypothetical protein